VKAYPKLIIDYFMHVRGYGKRKWFHEINNV
jgi:hypothetical protein